MIERQILLDRDHARGRIDRQCKRGLAHERATGDHAHDVAVGELLQVDRAAVGQRQARNEAVERQDIADAAACRRAVGAEQGIDVDDGAARIGRTQCLAAQQVGIVTLDDCAGIDRRNSRWNAFVERQRRFAVEDRICRGTIVEERELCGDIDRRTVNAVAIAISSGHHRTDRVRAEAERIVGIGIQRMIEAHVKLNRRYARRRVDRDGECRLARKRTRALDHTDHYAIA